MFINEIGARKAELMREAFQGEMSGKIELTGTTFHLYGRNFNGGAIQSNCNHYKHEDLTIINTLEQHTLDEMDKELDYLKDLIQLRRTEILEPELVKKLSVIKFKRGNRKLVGISVEEYTVLNDVYKDRKIINETSLDYLEFSDTKNYQEEIQRYIESLEQKYSLNEKLQDK